MESAIEQWDETRVGGEKGRDGGGGGSARACGLVDSPSSFKLKISDDRLKTTREAPAFHGRSIYSREFSV